MLSSGNDLDDGFSDLGLSSGSSLFCVTGCGGGFREEAVDWLAVLLAAGVRDGTVADILGVGGAGRGDVFTVLHNGGCDVISHGGLGLFVVVVVAATSNYHNKKRIWANCA